ncbi:hypothetical protein TNCV_4538391 [Trichonephila clavipes]|uniref:Uncharacterized protein n=1 Tax=Trichonephila clavipes TaxID=2585209 RepID=A0A8X7BIY8_TRICX|nr:hypothetical protein TNCV_4538391 [Trichonephila clavipes]
MAQNTVIRYAGIAIPSCSQVVIVPTWYCDTLIEIERCDLEKAAWVSQMWRSVVGGQCETTLGNDNAKPYCNSWLGRLHHSPVLISHQVTFICFRL